MSDDANTIIRERDQLAAKRYRFDSWWQQIGYRVAPAEAQFIVKGPEGEKRTERAFTGKPELANNRYAAVMQDINTPGGQFWHELRVPDIALDDDRDAKVYLDRLNKALFSMRYRAAANFAAQKFQGYIGQGAFGNSCLFIDEDVGRGPRYKHLPLREIHWSVNHQGRVDRLYRKFVLTARQCQERADHDGWQIPQKILDTVKTNAEQEFDFIHAVIPNDGWVPGRLDAKGMKYTSIYVALENTQVVSSGGYRCWPFAVSRMALAPGEIYGRGPAMMCWPSILTLNEQKKTILRAGQKVVSPPLLLAEEGILEAFSARPDATNFGYMTDDGKPLVAPLQTGANIPLGLELMEIEVSDIEGAFHIDVYKQLAEHPDMTATMVLELAQQRATLLAPMATLQQSEDLGPLIEREIDILSTMSAFAWISQDMPDSIRERAGTDEMYRTEYTSPLTRAMRAGEGAAIMRTMEALPAAMQVDPDAALVMDVKESIRTLAEINGVPPSLMRDPKLVAMMAQQKAQQQQLQMAAQAAPDISQSALNAAKADQLRRGVSA